MRAVVPEAEFAHLRAAGHAVPIRLHCRNHRLIRRRRLDAVLASRHHQAGGESLHIPLERPGQRLVKVAQVKQEVPLGRRPEAKVEDVSVAAELHQQPAVRPGGEIGSHHRRRSAVVVPRRSHHAAMPYGEQLGNPDCVLGDDRVERVVPARGLVPACKRAAWSPLACRLAGRLSLLDGLPEVVHRRRRRRSRAGIGLRHEGSPRSASGVQPKSLRWKHELRGLAGQQRIQNARRFLVHVRRRMPPRRMHVNPEDAARQGH
ncbi:MAG: hypothetical protein AW07_04747 [Candidatus Accumulibacter sp. SK-11]|nr:MAG: hypothetical protein AW07_04747 [Candidatus Accumulibacter sp. SK-11]